MPRRDHRLAPRFHATPPRPVLPMQHLRHGPSARSAHTPRVARSPVPHASGPLQHRPELTGPHIGRRARRCTSAPPARNGLAGLARAPGAPMPPRPRPRSVAHTSHAHAPHITHATHRRAGRAGRPSSRRAKRWRWNRRWRRAHTPIRPLRRPASRPCRSLGCSAPTGARANSTCSRPWVSLHSAGFRPELGVSASRAREKAG